MIIPGLRQNLCLTKIQPPPAWTLQKIKQFYFNLSPVNQWSIKMALFTLFYSSVQYTNTARFSFRWVKINFFFRVSGLSDPRFTFSQINTFFFPKQAPSLEVTFWGVGLDYRSLSSRIAQLLLEKSRITGKLLHIELYNIFTWAMPEKLYLSRYHHKIQ